MILRPEDKIEIYKDEKLLDLAGNKMLKLKQEELNFILSDMEVDENGRTREDVEKDMIAIYEETNEYLRNHYPNNSVADTWIAVNQFSIDRMKENLS